MGTKQTFLYLGKKASVVSSLAFLLLLAQPCAANDSSVSVALPLVSNNCVSQDSVTTANPYCQANTMYEEAMALSDKAKRTEKLNAAVEVINSTFPHENTWIYSIKTTDFTIKIIILTCKRHPFSSII